MSKSERDMWEIAKAFIDEFGMVKHQIERYNNFINSSIKEIIDKNKIVEVCVGNRKFKIEFGDPIIQTPSFKEGINKPIDITPMECIKREITYQCRLFFDVTTTNVLGDKKVYEKVHFASIPVMTRSELCYLSKIKHDKEALVKIGENINGYGGTFIIKGGEKVVVPQEKTAFNKVYVFTNRKKAPKFEIYSEIRSFSHLTSHSTNTHVGFIKGLLYVTIQWLDSYAIPLGIIFFGLGVKSVNDIIDFITPTIDDNKINDLLVTSLEYAYNCGNTKDALLYIGKKGKKISDERKKKEVEITSDSEDEFEFDNEDELEAISYASHLLENEFLPHLGKDFEKKKYYLGYMVRKLLHTKLGRIPFENRDNFENKRITTIEERLRMQFSSAFRKVISDLKTGVEKNLKENNPVSVLNFIRPKKITSSLTSAIANSNWDKVNKQGISQVIDNFNEISTLSHLRRLFTPTGNESGKVTGPRELHNSHFGIICMSETPEGRKVGLVKNLAFGALITNKSDPTLIIKVIEEIGIVKFENIIDTCDSFLKLPMIFVNGDPIGVSHNIENVVDFLRKLRRTCSIDYEISISYNPLSKEIIILTDAGRLIRPLLIVENGELLLTPEDIVGIKNGQWDDPSIWSNLMEQGKIEFLDKVEESNCLIAFFPEDLEKMDSKRRMEITHCEIHPSLMMGVGAGTIPFSNCNQSPRNTYVSCMKRQAVDSPLTVPFLVKGTTHVLSYPQKPIVQTKMGKLLGWDEHSPGQNAIVAICPWNGKNQEDSIVMNKSAIDRGLFLTESYFPFVTFAKADKKEYFEVPLQEECENFGGQTSKLDPETGIIKEGSKVEYGDILIGKTSVAKKLTQRKPKVDISTIYDQKKSGTVYKVEKGTNGQGYVYYRVVVVQLRYPQIGDKFSSNHGQKGTIGDIVPSEDMPFNSEGIVPDILINPLAFPSRMTIAMMIEMLKGKEISVGSKLNSIEVKDVFKFDDDSQFNFEDSNDLQNIEYSKFKSDRDATPFDNNKLSEITSELKNMGYNEFGYEKLTNGATGKEIPSLIFIGVCFYMRLKHMVSDKIHSRSRGNKVQLTNQPPVGKRCNGGLRSGNMEVNNYIAHGSVEFLKDRMMEQSDEFFEWRCSICGLSVPYTEGDEKAKISSRKECKVCQSSELSLVKIPFATKLLCQEVSGIGFMPRLITIPSREI